MNNLIAVMAVAEDEYGDFVYGASKAADSGPRFFMPWAYGTADMKWFKEHTVGTTVIMGRNTP